MTRNTPLSIRLPTRRARLVGSSALAGLALAVASSAYALPTGANVVAGAAAVAGTPGALTITQTSQNAAINWQTFNIGQGEAVTFAQPNASAIVLNRVLGADPSAILGRLSANGQVFIVNPNGVLFGAGAQVNVAGLVASTLNISDADLMAGRYSFSGPGGSVTNLGAINADGGVVALLGGEVSNQGVISARLGTVALAAGEAVTLDFRGDGLLNVSVDREAVGALVRNGGMIRADGGQVLLNARAAGGLMKTVVNNTGAIEARTLETRGGVIRLVGDGGLVAVGGTLDATGLGDGQRGGDIVVTGQAVALSGARLDASGHAGGGSVRVGGGYQGRDADVANAQSVDFGADASIAVDAIQSGDGGRAIVWSDGLTTMLGTIDARGGAVSGNGGFAETSGKQLVLGASARVYTLAAYGTTGLWLLDPTNWVIGAGGDETVAQVIASLAIADRVITADNNISVVSALSWGTSHNLTLNAGNDIVVSADVVASGPGAKLILIAGHDVSVSGAVTNSTAGGLLQYRAGNDLTISGAQTASEHGAFIDLSAGHNLTQAAAITSSGPGPGAGGRVRMVADSDGTGGTGGGTVILATPAQVTSDRLSIFYSPQNGYASPNSYAGVSVAPANFTAQMWAFASAANKVYDGTTAATLAFVGDPTVGGSINVGLGGGATFVDKNVGTLKAVNLSGAALTGSAAPNFALYDGSGSATASITPATLTITADSAAKSYGQEITFAGGAFTSVGLVAGETIGSVTETSPGAAASATAAGSPYVITPAGAVGGTFSLANYTTTYVNGLLTIAAVGLVVTPNSFSKDYGQTLTFSGQEFTATGLRNGDTIGSVTLASLGAAPTAGVAAGPYVVTGSNATGGSFTPGDYVISYGVGSLAVVPVALLVTANNATKVYGDTATFAPGAFRVSGLRNGETATTASESSAGAAAGAPVAGSPYAIAVSNLGGGTYTASNYVTTYAPGILTVTPAPLLVTASNVTKVYGDTVVFAPGAFAITGLKNGDTATSVTESSAGAVSGAAVGGSPYAIAVSNLTGGTYTASNYATTYAPGVLRVTPAALVIRANDATKPYLQTLTFTGQEFSTTGLRNGETVGSVGLSSPGATASAVPTSTPYAITASGGAGGTYTPGNYAISYTAGSLAVTVPAAAETASGSAVSSIASYTGFTPDGRSEGTTVPSATEVREAERERARRGVDGGSGLAQSVAGPAGVNLAVAGDGVRMPAYQLAEVRAVDTGTAVQVEGPQQAPMQAAPVRAAPAEVAPVRPRRQGRN